MLSGSKMAAFAVAAALVVAPCLYGCGGQGEGAKPTSDAASEKVASKVEVPIVTYWYQEQAEEILADAGLTLGKVSKRETQESYEGLVLEQSPAEGESVDEGTAVDVVVATGLPIPTEVEVADLTGMTPEEAELELIMSWVMPLPGEPVYSDDVEPGKVCAQSSAPGTRLPVTEDDFKNGAWPVVSYSVSLGKESVTVPDVVGKSSQDARQALEDAGLAFDTTTSYRDDVAQDVVASQSVAKGTSVPKGSVVTIDVSQGKRPAPKVRVFVPDVRTYSLDEARRSLESCGLSYEYSGDESGRVVSVTPNPGTEVDQGSKVTFTLQRTVEQEHERQREEQERQRQEQERQRQEQERQEQERQRQEQERQRQEQESTVELGGGADADQSEQVQSVIPDYQAIEAAVSAVGVTGSAPEASATLVSENPPLYLVHFVWEDQLWEVSVDGATGVVQTMETV